MKLKKRNPSDPEVTERVLAHIRTMSPEDLLKMLSYRKEGVEETDMNGTLAEYDRARKNQTGQSSTA